MTYCLVVYSLQMPQGRPRLPGTEAQRAAARRQQIRENVRAYRRRRRARGLSEIQVGSSETIETKEESPSGSSTDKSLSKFPMPQIILFERPGRQVSITLG